MSGAEPVDYARDVKPILKEKCFACHGTLKQESGLRLDAATLIRAGGDSGPAIAPGLPAASLLIERVGAEDASVRMPPQGEGEPLSTAQIGVLREWIAQGAHAPDEPVPADPRRHWAYQPPVRSQVPVPGSTALAAWRRNEIDTFIAAAFEERGLSPAEAAPSDVLLRRLYLDLIGLPPSREALQAFRDDPSPEAYDRVVDQLLASPQYGERWARHWMDVWRYSDWAGFGDEIRYSQRHMWRWRDWIVESLNADKGYDRMLAEMLAADELRPEDERAARATGFLARNWYKFDRNTWLDDTVEHTAKAFLATTLACARCHDHKYDPISQREYYRFRAIFEPYDVRTDPLPGERDLNRDGLTRVYDARPEASTYLFVRGDPKRPDEGHPLAPGVPAVLGDEGFAIAAVSLPIESYYPALREFVGPELVAEQQRAVAAAQAALTEGQAAAGEKAALAEKALASARAKLAAIKARLAAERAKYAGSASFEALAAAAARAGRLAAVAQAEERLLLVEHEFSQARAEPPRKGDPAQAIAAAEKKVEEARKSLDEARTALEQESTGYEPLGPVYPPESTGRRLALARWITDRSNPLTARVAVNHVWMRHFGRPLVENVADFGLRTSRPEHAALLDDLAVRFMDEGWSMKWLHRTIVTSATYRRSCVPGPADAGNLRIDPENRFFWRRDAQRMEAEVVRDSVLRAAGSLDLTVGGPDLDHNQGLTNGRRSMYFRHAREKQMEFLQLFDAANPGECYRRRPTIRPQQAFALMNSPLALAQSRLLAERLSSVADADDFISAAFETVLTRRPTETEAVACREFLAEQIQRLSEPEGLEPLGDSDESVPAAADPAQRARENLVLVLFNHHDFVTIY